MQNGTELTDIYGRVEKFTKYMDNLLNQLFDVTFPIAAILRGRSFNKWDVCVAMCSMAHLSIRIIHDTFRDKAIEDLWLPFYCISTDMSEMTMRVHRHVRSVVFPECS